MPTREIVVIAGPPGGGKTTHVSRYMGQGYTRLNRDEMGGSLQGLLIQRLDEMVADIIDAGDAKIVLDNTYATRESRAPLLALARKHNIPVHMKWMMTTPEQAQFFAARRQIQRYGKLFTAADYKAHKNDPNMFPPAAQFAYWKRVEKPTTDEGFASIEEIPVRITFGPEYKNRAILLDYDGTLRVTRSGAKYPTSTSDVQVLPGRKNLLEAKQKEGFILLGVSNQSGCAKDPDEEGYVSQATASACFEVTNSQLGLHIDYLFAPDKAGVPYTYWRKPLCGMGVLFIERYKLCPASCIVIGDMKTDATFAARCGFQFCSADQFFREK